MSVGPGLPEIDRFRRFLYHDLYRDFCSPPGPLGVGMRSKLARVSSSNDNIAQLDRARLSQPERVGAGPILSPGLYHDFGSRRPSPKARKGRKYQLTPALIDDLKTGKIEDPETGGLAIEVLSSGKKRWRFRRRLAGHRGLLRLSLGLYPAYTIAAAREWANRLNLSAGTTSSGIWSGLLVGDLQLR
jgi:hypothetical protein